MTIINPDKYIRKAFINAIESATGLPVWHKKVPKDTNPVPVKYIIIDNQSKGQNTIAKSTTDANNYFEWYCTLDVNIYNINPVGYSKTSVIDDIEQTVINVILNGINIDFFSNKNASILDTQDLSSESSTQSIDRKLVKFEHWLNRAES